MHLCQGLKLIVPTLSPGRDSVASPVAMRPVRSSRSIGCGSGDGLRSAFRFRNLADFDALHMECAPRAEGFQGRIERLAERRERVFDARRNLPEVPPLDDAVRIHLLE